MLVVRSGGVVVVYLGTNNDGDSRVERTIELLSCIEAGPLWKTRTLNRRLAATQSLCHFSRRSAEDRLVLMGRDSLVALFVQYTSTSLGYIFEILDK